MNNAFLVPPTDVCIIGNERNASHFVYLYAGDGKPAACFCVNRAAMAVARVALASAPRLAAETSPADELMSFIIQKAGRKFIGMGGDGRHADMKNIIPEASMIAAGISAQAEAEGNPDCVHFIAMLGNDSCAIIAVNGEQEGRAVSAERIHFVAMQHFLDDDDDGHDEESCSGDRFCDCHNGDDDDVVLGCGFLFDSSAGDLVLEIPINSRWECDNGNEPIALKNIGVAVQVMFEECQKDPGAAAAFADDLGRALLVFFGDALRKKWVGSPDTGKEKGDEDGDNLCFYFDIAKMPDFRAEHAPGWVRIERKLHIPTKEQVLAAHRI